MKNETHLQKKYYTDLIYTFCIFKLSLTINLVHM